VVTPTAEAKAARAIAASNGPLRLYEHLICTGVVERDRHQVGALEHLQRLFDVILQRKALFEWSGNASASTDTRSSPSDAPPALSAVKKWFLGVSKHTPPVQTTNTSESSLHNTSLRGIYLYGDVGCGKSFVMDLFYECVPIARKQRVHFHAFMRDVHRQMHVWRTQERADHEHDPIPPLAKKLASNARLLCFDEFQVSDVGDAAILHRLFRLLIVEHGVLVISTSNRPPEDLYKGGIQRDLFLPFIDLLKERLFVYSINSGVDHRLSGKLVTQVYHYPITPKSVEHMETLWKELTHNKVEKPTTLTVNGRLWTLPRTAHGMVRCTFEELCDRPLGPSDFLELSKHFHTLVLDDIPVMTMRQKSQARRFITLVDALYEAKVKLICSAHGEPKDLFRQTLEEDELRDFDVAVLEKPVIYESDIDEGILPPDEPSIYSGQEEVFMFARAVSRLTEMRSDKYLRQAHHSKK